MPPASEKSTFMMIYLIRRNKMGIRLIYAWLFVFLLSACSTPSITKVSDTMAIKDYIPPKTEKKAEAEAVAVPEEKRVPESQEKVSLFIRDIEIKDVLFLLSKDSSLPIVADKDVQGKVTVNIKDKSIFEVLEAVMKPLGYMVFVEDGIIRVTNPRLVSKSFHVNYIRGSRNSSSTMNASISAQSSGQHGETQPVPSGGGTGTTGVKITTEDKANFWKELSKGLEVLIFGEAGAGGEGGFSKGDKGGKKLILNEQSGLVYVKDYSDNMKKIQAFLEDIQNSVRRQVMIQAHFIEVTLNDTYSLGIDWNAIDFKGGDFLSVSQKLIPLSAEHFFQIKLTNNKIDALLDAMKQQGTLNILSSPRISAINNQKALVKLTSREVSWLTKTTVIPGTTNITETTNTPQIDEVGIFLDVTPQIDDEDMITMYIHPSISEITEMSVSPDKKSNMPVIATREVDTIVNARTGQTVVIAGLIKDKISETKRSVPLLGDIPLLGNLFSQINQEKTKTELVILLTPYILNEQYTGDMSRESEERLSKFGRKFRPVPQLNEP